MFEKEIQFITDFSLNTIKSLGSSFTINSLFNIDLHPALTKYVSGRLDYMIYEERKTLLENSRFDYSGAKIAEYFHLISEEIKKTKKFSFLDLEDFIKKGVIFNANFSVRPKSTLTNLIFKDASAYRNTSEIKVYLNYLYYYNYYDEIINSYINKKKIVSISKDEFQILLDKIDGELLSSRKEEIISDALNSISDFYNIGSISSSAIQSPLVEAYMKEKNLDIMIELLHKEITDNRKKVSVGEFKRILFSQLKMKNEVEVKLIEISKEEESKIEPESSNEILPEIEFKEEKREEGIIKERKNKEKNEGKVKNERIEKFKETENKSDAPNDKERLNKLLETQIQNENQENLIELDQEENKSTEAIIEEEIIDNYDIEEESEIEEIVEESNISGKNRNRKKDLFSFLTQKEIDKIISSIFNDDEDDFANTLEKLAECSDYERAAEILESVFYTYKVNPYKREAVTLTNAVSNYFNQVL